jgi:hypothetical protein
MILEEFLETIAVLSLTPFSYWMNPTKTVKIDH